MPRWSCRPNNRVPIEPTDLALMYLRVCSSIFALFTQEALRSHYFLRQLAGRPDGTETSNKSYQSPVTSEPRGLVPPLSFRCQQKHIITSITLKEAGSTSYYSLLRSLASIHLDSFDNKMTPPQSRRHSTLVIAKYQGPVFVVLHQDEPRWVIFLSTKINHVSHQCLHLMIGLTSRYQFRHFRLILTNCLAQRSKSKITLINNLNLIVLDATIDDYTLGEKARSFSHMMDAIRPQSVYQLKNGDFAFVKRSNGSWTYAMLAHRSRGSSYEDEHMMFVLDEKGSSKVIDEKDWARFIRCLAESEDQSQ
eukprot:scaffold102510_cov57-Cyclotella_meneghiniana.AAC.3